MPSEFSDMIEDMMDFTGEDFEIIREGNSHTIKGCKYSEKGTNRKYVAFRPGTDIQPGDTLRRKASREDSVVVEVDPHVVQGEVFTVNAYYETKRESDERKRTQSASVSYTFHNSSNIIAGNQATAAININIGHIETEINERGGADKEQLRAMVQAIKEAFEQQDSLRKGSLAKYSEMIEKHSWIAGSLVQLLGSAAMQFLMGK